MNIQVLHLIFQHNLQQIIKALKHVYTDLYPTGCFIVSADSCLPACKPISQTGLDVAIYWKGTGTQ